MKLSFDSCSLDLIMHFDVLEPVPGWRMTLDKCYRVLRKEGKNFFTCPFYHNLETNLIRARVREDGSIGNLLTPVFHGNPVS